MKIDYDPSQPELCSRSIWSNGKNVSLFIGFIHSLWELVQILVTLNVAHFSIRKTRTNHML